MVAVYGADVYQSNEPNLKAQLWVTLGVARDLVSDEKRSVNARSKPDPLRLKLYDALDLFKNNQLLHALSPLVFSHHLGAQ